jgi:hypothetical protein
MSSAVILCPITHILYSYCTQWRDGAVIGRLEAVLPHLCPDDTLKVHEG